MSRLAIFIDYTFLLLLRRRFDAAMLRQPLPIADVSFSPPPLIIDAAAFDFASLRFDFFRHFASALWRRDIDSYTMRCYGAALTCPIPLGLACHYHAAFSPCHCFRAIGAASSYAIYAAGRCMLLSRRLPPHTADYFRHDAAALTCHKPYTYVYFRAADADATPLTPLRFLFRFSLRLRCLALSPLSFLPFAFAAAFLHF